jgi:hypothetical protein
MADELVCEVCDEGIEAAPGAAAAGVQASVSAAAVAAAGVQMSVLASPLQ